MKLSFFAKTIKILANCCIKIRNLRHFLFFQVSLIKFVLLVFKCSNLIKFN